LFIAAQGEEHPHCLTDEIDMEKHVHNEKSQKFLIVFATDAVVEVFAVMVELLRAASTLFAMMGADQSVTARVTESQPFGVDFVSQLRIVDNGVHGVVHENPHIVVANDQ
jgi:hypothetical protein